jgi:hypothetical protein
MTRAQKPKRCCDVGTGWGCAGAVDPRLAAGDATDAFFAVKRSGHQFVIFAGRLNMLFSCKTGFLFRLLVSVVLLLFGSGARSEQQDSPQMCAAALPCACPTLEDPMRGTPARIFAGGPPGQDRLVIEDAVTGDAYRYLNPGWQRIGGSARTYALRTNIYRLAGDARPEIAIDDMDNWQRLGAAVVGSDIFASINNLYLVKPATAILPTVLYRWDGAVAMVVDTVAAGPAAYAGNDSGVYKRTSSATFKYDGTSNSWSQIGSEAAMDLYPAANTLFIRSGSSIMRYLNAPFQWANLGTGLGKITGTTTAAYAIAGGNIVRLDPGNVRTTVRGTGDARDIAAGGAHLFVLTTAGTVFRLEDSGAWMDISCRGTSSITTCAICASGPIPSRLAPSYADVAQQTQNQPANLKHNILTRHSDNARTGAAAHENILTPSSLTTGGFGYIGSVAVTGRIFAQPLYVKDAAVVCSGQAVRNANIAYVATLENIVYAIDIDQRTVCWQTQALGGPQKAWAAGCSDRVADGACNQNFNLPSHGGSGGAETGVRVGIASTPVIDLAKSVMYVVTRVRDGSDPRGRYFVQVLDTRTGQLVAKVETIADTLNGRDDCNGKAFHPSLATQRAGLLLVNNKLFVAFSANAGEDSTIEYHGHVLGFDVSNPANPVNLTRSFCATPNPNILRTGLPETARGGGIWMAGAGLASDGTSAYFTTGNGAYEFINNNYVESKIPDKPGNGNWPNSFVKLAMDMSATGYTDARTIEQMYESPRPSYVPQLGGRNIWWARERSDADLGSGGVLLLGNRLIGGGKDGRLYVIDTATMSSIQDFQAFVHMYHVPKNGEVQKTYDFNTQWYDGPHLHGSPVAWDVRPASPYIYVYAWAEKDRLRRFRFDPSLGKFEEATDAKDIVPGSLRTVHGDLGVPGGMPGGMLSLSSNGPADGIIWATIQEPYKFCNKLDPLDGQGPRVLVDQPFTRGDTIPACTVMEGYVPGRLYAFAAEVDSASLPGANSLKLLWGDTNVSGMPTSGFPGTSVLPNNFIPAYAKHTPPTIAHGKVLVATANGELRIYGLGSTNLPRQRQTADLRTNDIALAGLPGWPGIDLAVSNGDCSFNATTYANATLASWASAPNVARLAGDFNGDGHTDIALVGGGAWTLAKIAFSNGDGTFNLLQGAAPNFIKWATSSSAARLVGDFDGDGQSDIALVGDPNWHTMPVAFSNGDASFRVTNAAPPLHFAELAMRAGVTKLVGDFNGDGRSDIALVGDPRWHTIPIAFSRGDGSFRVGNVAHVLLALPAEGMAGNFGLDWAPYAAERIVGDFNGDGRDDIALIGNSTWHTIPVAFSDGFEAFRITNGEVGRFAAWAALPGVTRLVGDFNGDGRADIALVSVPTSMTAGTLPIAFSNGDGTFRVTTTEFPDGGFRIWAGTPNVHPIMGDFNRDGYADIALTGGAGWFTIPCALSRGDGSFVVHNAPTNLATFAARSAEAGANRTLRPTGDYR